MTDAVVFKDIEFTIGKFSLKNVNFSIKDGEYFVILGPSGNGKTQLLKLLAGLNRPKSGEVWIGGVRRDHLPPEERDIGFVFQDQVLFPHMDVYDNIAFSLRVKKVGRAEIKERVAKISGILGAHEISISAVIQKGREIDSSVPIVMLTHEAKESNVRQALSEMIRLDVLTDETILIRVEEKSVDLE